MGLKSNIAYSSLLTVSLYIAQFITYPYVARVLGVTNIGTCNFVQNFVQWFVLFAMLGINVLGVREISRCGGNREKLSRTFSGLVQFNMACTVLVLAVYLPIVLLAPQLAEYKQLLIFGAIQIVFTGMTWEWLFKGLEDFRYITLRCLFVRLLYVISVFVFIRSPNDYDLYFFILVGSVVVNAFVNIPCAFRRIHWQYIPWGEVFSRFFRPSLILGLYQFLTGMYLSFTVVYLGFIAGNEQVGLYTTATKLQNVILALYSAVTVVMMPRVSSLLAQGKKENAHGVILKSVRLLFVFCIPVIMVSEFFASEMIYILAGDGYGGAVLLFRIAVPLILIIGLEQIFIVQVLMPMAKDRAILVNSLIGAILGVSLNLILVPMFHSVGSIVVWCCCEVAVLISAVIFLRKELEFQDYLMEFGRDIIAFSPLLILLSVICHVSGSVWMFITGCILTVLYTHVVLYHVLKDESYAILWRQIIQRYR